MTNSAQEYSGLPAQEARLQIKNALRKSDRILDQQTTPQSVRVHERCDTPVEYIVTPQWFIKVLEFKDQFIKIGDQLDWHPENMKARYLAWVENLHWDWCISRQRYYGVPFPVWYCDACGEVSVAEENELPVDPLEQSPLNACKCGSMDFTPDGDVMDTWATSSMTPQIVGDWLGCRETASNTLYRRVFPFSLRPQAHEIIRTWAFYTIVKSQFHFGTLPWKDVLISGWGIAGEGMGKISKSRGGGAISPMEMINRYSADAVRYWAASTALGKDSIISEDKIQMGSKLVTKLWNVARFSEPFFQDSIPSYAPSAMTTADRWIVASLQQLIQRASEFYRRYEYAAAKNEIESFFWHDLADNYLEMSKVRLYNADHPLHEGARFALYHALLATIKLFAPILPFVTEAVYQGLFALHEQPAHKDASIHNSLWPTIDPRFTDSAAIEIGESLVLIASAVRRFKSEKNLALGSELTRLQLTAREVHIVQALSGAIPDLMSVTRARQIEIVENLDPSLVTFSVDHQIGIAVHI